MPDEIKPALTPEEWKPKLTYGDGESPQISETPGELPNLWISDGQIFVDNSALEYGPARLPPFKVMALANAALPDGDPRKITREKLRALDAIIEVGGGHCDKGPPGEGWQSDELIATLDAVRNLRDSLAALLPPNA